MTWTRDYSPPDGISDELVAAVGKLREAMERLERVRGHLYELHQLMGRTDRLFGEAAQALAIAGAPQQADLVEQQIVGRNILEDRWSFEVVDEFNRTYYEPVKAIVEQAEKDLMTGRRHVFEAALKRARREGKQYDGPAGA